MTDPTPLWDFDDPAGSEQRFREAAAIAEGADQLVLLTQVARALGLQERYDEAHGVLDHLATSDQEVATRISLERGRLLRSAGRARRGAAPLRGGRGVGARAGLDVLLIDALHMVALVAAGRRAALSQPGGAGRCARPPTYRRCARLGRLTAQQHRHDPRRCRRLRVAALAAFEEALTARERIGDAARTRVARWMVAWTLRNLGRNRRGAERAAQP